VQGVDLSGRTGDPMINIATGTVIVTGTVGCPLVPHQLPSSAGQSVAGELGGRRVSFHEIIRCGICNGPVEYNRARDRYHCTYCNAEASGVAIRYGLHKDESWVKYPGRGVFSIAPTPPPPTPQAPAPPSTQVQAGIFACAVCGSSDVSIREIWPSLKGEVYACLRHDGTDHSCPTLMGERVGLLKRQSGHWTLEGSKWAGTGLRENGNFPNQGWWDVPPPGFKEAVSAAVEEFSDLQKMAAMAGTSFPVRPGKWATICDSVLKQVHLAMLDGYDGPISQAKRRVEAKRTLYSKLYGGVVAADQVADIAVPPSVNLPGCPVPVAGTYHYAEHTHGPALPQNREPVEYDGGLPLKGNSCTDCGTTCPSKGKASATQTACDNWSGLHGPKPPVPRSCTDCGTDCPNRGAKVAPLTNCEKWCTKPPEVVDEQPHQMRKLAKHGDWRGLWRGLISSRPPTIASAAGPGPASDEAPKPSTTPGVCSCGAPVHSAAPTREGHYWCETCVRTLTSCCDLEAWMKRRKEKEMSPMLGGARPYVLTGDLHGPKV
jgi:hypothetical protein